jgi:signal transduction histidine kinase
VNDLIREVMTFVRADLKQHRITVRTELVEDLPRIAGVRIQLQQVLLNLIANAADAMALVAQRARVLTVRSQKTGDCDIVVTVEDTGSGIDPAGLERVFEPFFSTKSDGMGMGLSICRSIIEAHGGRITAAPVREGGSVFRVSLPCDEPSQST